MIKWILNRLGATGTKNISLESPPKPVVAPPLPPNKTIVYRLTDPLGNPALIKQEEASPQLAPFFQVIGFIGGGYALDTAEGQAASLYMNIDKGLKNYRTYAEKVMDRWRAVSVLTVVPRAGRQLNAYYDRRTLSFFFDKNIELNKDVFTSDSPDVTVHELGHAVLDFKRPDFWSIANMEIAAVHEAWADIFSITAQLQHPEVAQAMLQMTQGDIRIPNVISCLAEELGKTIYDDFHVAGMNPLWLRSAINSFKYVNPRTLPQEASVDQLAAESHSFSRILTGMCYDLMVVIYETEKASGKDPLTALMNAARGLGWYVDRVTNRMPNTTEAFHAFAATLLQVDKEMSQSYYQQKILDILQNRNLYSVMALSTPKHPKLISIRLRDTLRHNELTALDYNPLYDVEVQIPDEGSLLGGQSSAILATKQFLDYLHVHNKVSRSPDTPWEILGDKLVRSHFDSGCYFQNWLNPTQPEYYKPPKPQNNFCPCGCKEQLEKGGEVANERLVVRESNNRAKQLLDYAKFTN